MSVKPTTSTHSTSTTNKPCNPNTIPDNCPGCSPGAGCAVGDLIVKGLADLLVSNAPHPQQGVNWTPYLIIGGGVVGLIILAMVIH